MAVGIGGPGRVDRPELLDPPLPFAVEPEGFNHVHKRRPATPASGKGEVGTLIADFLPNASAAGAYTRARNGLAMDPGEGQVGNVRQEEGERMAVRSEPLWAWLCSISEPQDAIKRRINCVLALPAGLDQLQSANPHHYANVLLLGLSGK